MSVIPALGREAREEDREFKASLGYIARSSVLNNASFLVTFRAGGGAKMVQCLLHKC
jgi:hypothetical protein